MWCGGGGIYLWQGDENEVSEGFWRGLGHYQEDACYDFYITSLAPDNLAGWKKG